MEAGEGFRLSGKACGECHYHCPARRIFGIKRRACDA
jgi:hypothetical protein